MAAPPAERTPAAVSRDPNDVLANLPCGFVSFADDGRVLYTSAEFRQMLGYGDGELEGGHIERALSLAARIFYQTHMFPLLRLKGEARELFFLLRRKDGTDVGVLANAVRRTYGDAAVNDCVLVELRERRKYEDALLEARRAAERANAALESRAHELEDLTDRLQQQTLELELQQQQLQEQAVELERARAQADEANEAKSHFLASMSHELRTPLNAIGGYAQLLDMGVHGELTPPQREAVDRIARSQRHLLRLVNEVLNLARIEAGRVDYTITDIPVSAMIESVRPIVEPLIAAAGLSCAFDAADVRVRSDRDKAQQILINLLTNATKFTPAGGRITLRTEPDGDARVLLRVTDTGIGISADKLSSIFEPFVQVRSSEQPQREGTGLGLAISRDLARGMGGDLTAESTPGAGSTFTLALPAA